MNIILGTDWWTDCDDVAALRLMAREHKAGNIRLCGVVINACMEHSVASLSALLCSEGLGALPIGLDRAATDFDMREKMYQVNMAKYPHRLTNETAEDAVRLYRRLLSSSSEKCDIVEIGYPHTLASLLQSEADALSPLTGLELVSQKVRKLWIMAGNWEKETGLENNFARNQRSRIGGSYVCASWPTEVTFLGWEVGNTVITGDTIRDKDDILYRAMAEIGFPMGRSSWDPMLCLMACRSDEEKAGYSTVRGRAYVDAATGENRFERAENGKHCYVVKKYDDAYYSDQINKIIE